MIYRTVFDVGMSGHQTWSVVLPGLAGMAIGAVMFVSRKSVPGWWGRHPRATTVFTGFFLAFVCLLTVLEVVSSYSDHSRLTEALRSGRASVAVGSVSNFKPMPAAGHAMERFCVSAACFEYSDFIITGAFNNTSSHGGPIREGLPVRVTYVGNSIVKLEVGQ